MITGCREVEEMEFKPYRFECPGCRQTITTEVDLNSTGCGDKFRQAMEQAGYRMGGNDFARDCYYCRDCCAPRGPLRPRVSGGWGGVRGSADAMHEDASWCRVRCQR